MGQSWSVKLGTSTALTVATVFETTYSWRVAAVDAYGAVSTGALAATFTSSQGLLLMIPVMYKVGGELTPVVFHVAARSVATHALSIFGDHSDVMAERGCGLGLLCSGSIQEVTDLAAISHAASLETRLPFVHFFDGFRTSHEILKIQTLTAEELNGLIDRKTLEAHRDRGLTPDRPTIKGTATQCIT